MKSSLLLAPLAFLATLALAQPTTPLPMTTRSRAG